MTAREQGGVLQQALDQVDCLEQELQGLRDQLAWSNRLSTLGTLAAALAHEYNNLLTPIASYAQLAIAEPNNTDMTHRALHIAAEGAAKAGRLADATLGFVSPRLDNESDSCIAKDTVEQTLHYIAPLLNSDGIIVKVDVPDTVVAIDALGLQQVLINLINNARNAMQGMRSKRIIRIKGKENNENLILEIEDNGPGVDPSMRDKLFDAFATQGPAKGSSESDVVANDANLPTQKQAGSGLGLSICKKLIESAGGQISLQPTADQGACFRIELPRQADE